MAVEYIINIENFRYPLRTGDDFVSLDGYSTGVPDRP
jgi:hypothetical protein